MSISWTPAFGNRTNAVIKIKFSMRDCQGCEHRAACTGGTAETVAQRPPADKGWISVSIVRTDKIKGPVTVAIGVANAAGQVPVVASIEGSTRPAYRYFFRDRGRFPGSITL